MRATFSKNYKKKNTTKLVFKRNFYKKCFLFTSFFFLFAPDGVMCLYMRLKSGHKTPEPSGWKGYVKLHRGREEVLCSKD